MKKFNIDQRKFKLFTGGKPCEPGRIRNLSEEEGESMMERMDKLRERDNQSCGNRSCNKYAPTEHLQNETI